MMGSDPVLGLQNVKVLLGWVNEQTFADTSRGTPPGNSACAYPAPRLESSYILRSCRKITLSIY